MLPFSEPSNTYTKLLFKDWCYNVILQDKPNRKCSYHFHNNINKQTNKQKVIRIFWEIHGKEKEGNVHAYRVHVLTNQFHKNFPPKTRFVILHILLSCNIFAMLVVRCLWCAKSPLNFVHASCNPSICQKWRLKS